MSMIGAAMLTQQQGQGGGQAALTGYFTLLNDPGGQIGSTPGLLHRVILVQ